MPDEEINFVRVSRSLICWESLCESFLYLRAPQAKDAIDTGCMKLLYEAPDDMHVKSTVHMARMREGAWRCVGFRLMSESDTQG